ncbi:MAG TPA: zinc-dependent metalloproteinase lipoprotein [Bacteroides reticulotermitis]|nr:zinc-dependent metalloproteinase lipoprotein [Bacteroides reticulotermitis]
MAPNIEQKSRTGTIKISSDQISRSVTITQHAITLTEAEINSYSYKIPVVFHILYQNKTTSTQYIKEGRVNEIIAACNKLYGGSTNSSNINIEFILATEDEKGNTLTEPGVDRIEVSNPIFDCEDFMEDETKLKYVWDTDKYVNIFLYQFTNENILGISHLPYTVEPDQLDGLNSLNFLPTHSSLNYPHCVSINNTYIYTESIVEGQFYTSVDVVATIAHELGHYLGLHHAFNEAEDGNIDLCEDTDFCEDTPAYNRYEYQEYVTEYSQNKKLTYEDIVVLSQRTDCKTHITSTPNNIMDYEISFMNRFTNDQKARIRYVLTHSPLVPGPKVARSITRATTTPQEFPMRMIK